MTYRELKESGVRFLMDSGIETAKTDAVHILLSLCNISKTQYLLLQQEVVPENIVPEYYELIKKRSCRIPLQYVLGQTDFLGHSFSVGHGVLIPRPETEELANLCAERIRKNKYHNVFDLCAGSGCIGVSLALLCPFVQVWLIEKCDEALHYLKKNVPFSVSDRVHIVQADIFTYDPSLLPQPDMIVSNPPYIPSHEIGELQTEVQMEPRSALDGGDDGLVFYRCIAERWASCIRIGGFLALECGETQTNDVKNMLTDANSISELKDMYGLYRFVTAEY